VTLSCRTPTTVDHDNLLHEYEVFRTYITIVAAQCANAVIEN